MSDEQVAQLRDHAARNTDSLMMSAIRRHIAWEAADAIEALQQRCEELEQEVAKRHQIERLKIRSIALGDQRIAALEAALTKAADRLDLCAGKLEFVANKVIIDEARVWAEEARQALTSSEGAGKRPQHDYEFTHQGWCAICAKPEADPVHTDAGEGREDG